MSALLVLKLTLVPTLVAMASLAGRRFGPRVAGWLIGFPIVAGPVLGFYAHEQGNAFAAQAAAGTVLGIVALCGFLIVYLWASLRFGWVGCVLLGWAAFAALALPLARLPVPSQYWWIALAAAYLALTGTLYCLPASPALVASPHPSPRSQNLGPRVLATGVMVLTLTGLASVLGPSLSGVFTPFPVATTILVVFAQRETGTAGVLAVCAGFIPSLYSFAAFCAALAYALDLWPTAAAFAFAVLVSLISQAVVLTSVANARPS